MLDAFRPLTHAIRIDEFEPCFLKGMPDMFVGFAARRMLPSSNLRTIATERPAASASFSCDQSRSARAALICRAFKVPIRGMPTCTSVDVITG